MTTNNVLKEVITKISGANERVFSYAQDFDALWQMNANGAPNTPLIIVDTGFPATAVAGDGDFAKWVPSLAWAVTYCCHLRHLGQTTALIPAVHILDLSGGRPRAWGPPGDVQSFAAGRVNYYAPQKNAGCKFLEEFVKAIQNGDNGEAVIDARCWKNAVRDFWRMLCQANTQDFAGAENRHDVSNQLGALLLCAALPQSTPAEWCTTNKGTFYQATARMVHTVQGFLFPSPEPFPPFIKKAREDGRLSPTFLPQANRVKTVLVDDHHDKGFRLFLEKALGDGAEVIGWKGVFGKGTEYDSAATDTKKVLGKKLNFASDSLGMFQDIDVLFLDLRLWEPSPEAKKVTIEKYKSLGNSLVVKWPELCPKPPAYNLLKQALQTTSNPHSYRALAILPLIIAALDPALPIILFSSTQHRSVIQAVRGCTNILTEFSKPYLGGEDFDASDPQILLRELRLAVNRALEMVEIRRVWREAVNKWEEISLASLKWSDSWPAFEPAISPVKWLLNEWLPLAQRGEFALAAALPWLYMEDCLGETRLAILQNQQESSKTTKKAVNASDCLRLMESACKLFPRRSPGKGDHENDIKTQTLEREMALAAAVAFIELMALWGQTE